LLDEVEQSIGGGFANEVGNVMGQMIPGGRIAHETRGDHDREHYQGHDRQDRVEGERRCEAWARLITPFFERLPSQ
jgi:hypothetical protein